MKLYQFRWSYHSHLRFRLTLRDIHRWFAGVQALRINGRNSSMNPRQRKSRRCWYVTVTIWKNAGETDGNKKTSLHFWSEVFEVINTIWQRPRFLRFDRKSRPLFMGRMFWCMEMKTDLFPSWKAIVLRTKKRIRFAIDCKSDPFFQVSFKS